jgi:hypothetical protein
VKKEEEEWRKKMFSWVGGGSEVHMLIHLPKAI